MKINDVAIIKMKELDGLEIKSATFSNMRFPKHFHLDWSLVFLTTGRENVEFGNQKFLLSNQAVLLIPPYSVHSNWNNSDGMWKYNALYLNSDIVKFVVKKLKLDYSSLSSAPYFISYGCMSYDIHSNNHLNQLQKILKVLFSNHFLEDKKSFGNASPLDDILSYLESNYDSKITLDNLESQFKINKFKLLRAFKKSVGLSPQDYVSSIRIENSKKYLFSGYSLVHTAINSGFHDQSHFTHCFKKYVGITPNEYKSNCNILQETNFLKV
jgi:AraC-like DNA-binding protein